MWAKADYRHRVDLCGQFLDLEDFNAPTTGNIEVRRDPRNKHAFLFNVSSASDQIYSYANQTTEYYLFSTRTDEVFQANLIALSEPQQ